jgi:valyl-tRNA synthetase
VTANDATAPTGAATDKTYRPAEVEARIYAQWEASGAFRCDPASGKPPFAIVIPPPNVTGSLHMGHALNNTLQDILIRYRRMRGHDALWQPGTDHAGIATQAVVERQLAAEGVALARGREGDGAGNQKLIGREDFVARVWKWKEESGGTITRQLRRLGASTDWSRERFTMDDGLSAAVRKVFVDLYKQGLIYRDKRLVNWDPKLHTAISDLEVEQREIKGKLWYFRYPIEGSDEHIVVATTRPETMLGDTGVAVHPDNERWKHLIGKHAVLPVVGRRIAIVGDEYSDPEKGSGAVKITPAHDFNDFEVGRRHTLEAINIFDKDARINENAPAAYRGLDRFEARTKIVAEFEALGLLEKIEDHAHTVPHGDRSGVPIEPWLTDQWYVDAKTLAVKAIQAVDDGRTVFVPRQWTATYYEWMRNIQPWCISRQLWWGHQVPVWYGPDGKPFCDHDEAGAQAQARAHYGKDVALTRDPDVLDTWFSSALWPFSTLGWPEQTPHLRRYYPTDVLVTGFDIIFFWVARMMMMGLHFMGEVPFRTVYIHALVRDAKGAKMSKSKGNIIDPLDLIDKYGCDALRFTLTVLAAQGRDIKLAESRVEGSRNFATKLWNAVRYSQMNGVVKPVGFDPARARLTVNRWIIGELARTAATVERALEEFKFNEAAGAAYQFIWGAFCDWYLEFTKPVLTGADEAVKAETRQTTGFVLRETLKLLHPIMPFITEELWERLGCSDGRMLIAEAWPQLSGEIADPAADSEMGWIVRLIGRIRSLRAEYDIAAGAAIALELPGLGPAQAEALTRNEALVRRMAQTDLATREGAAIAGKAVEDVFEGTRLRLGVDAIDVAKQRDKFKRLIAKTEKDLADLDRRLANPQFLAKADPEAVEDLRERRAAEAATHAGYAHALERLAGL